MTPTLSASGHYALELMVLSQQDGTLNLAIRSISDDLRDHLGLPAGAQLIGRPAARLFSADGQLVEEWASFLLKVIRGFATIGTDADEDPDVVQDHFFQFFQAHKTWLHTDISYKRKLQMARLVFTDSRTSLPAGDTGRLVRLKQSLWLEHFVDEGYNWEIDLASSQILLSGKLARNLGLASDTAVLPVERFLATVHPGDIDAVTEALRQVEVAATIVPSRALLADGSLLHFSSFAIPGYDQTGKLTHIMGRTQDITEKEAAIAELQRSEQLFRGIVEGSQDVFAVVNMDGTIGYVSPKIKELAGFSAEDVIGQSFRTFMVGPGGQSQLAGRVEAILAGSKYERGEYHLRRGDGGDTYIQATFAALHDEDDQITGVVAVCRDITEDKIRTARLRHMGLHDTLTGAYNRLAFDNELKRIERDEALDVGLIVCDFNGLKLINNALGPERGDALLVEVYRLLLNLTAGRHRIYRVGGDEFAVIVHNTDREQLEDLCLRIDRVCQESTQTPLSFSISWGTAFRDSTALDTQALYKLAEGRMNAQKLLDNRSARSQVLASLKEALKSRHVETSEHMQRMENMVMALGRRLGLPSDAFDRLVLLASLHDIGKISIPDVIINKPAELTESEWIIMRSHSEAGYRIAMTSQELSDIAEAILCHHEHWDGSGYPNGRAGEDIPLLARIINVVDTYDVMTHQRVYKLAGSHEQAVVELRRCAGNQLDPDIVELFLDLFGSLSEREMRRYTGGDPETQQGTVLP